jgi:hypothetical protein
MNTDIAEKIELIHKIDQETRQQGKFNDEIDAQNSEKIKMIYEQIGFPTIEKVGKSASHRFVTILLHSQDTEFKKKCLEDMKYFSNDEIEKKDMAYLVDKIEITEGKGQVYGTQLTFNTEKDTYEVMDLQDSKSVNDRRLEVGLEPIEDYITFANGKRKEMMDNQSK